MIGAYDMALFFGELQDEAKVLTECQHELNMIELRVMLETETNNKKGGVISTLIQTIGKMLRWVRERIDHFTAQIGNKLRYKMSSKEAKAQLDNCQNYLATHPKEAEQTVSVKDWNKIEQSYDNAERQIDALLQNPSLTPEMVSKQASSIFKGLNTTVNTASATFTMNFVLTLARKSPKAAQELQQKMQFMQSGVDLIESELGKKEVQRMERKLQKYSKESLGYKLKVQLLGQKEKDLSECYTEWMQTLTTAVKSKTPDGVNGTKPDAKAIAKAAVENREMVRGLAKSYRKNKDFRDTVNNGIGMAGNVTGNENLKKASTFLKNHSK